MPRAPSMPNSDPARPSAAGFLPAGRWERMGLIVTVPMAPLPRPALGSHHDGPPPIAQLCFRLQAAARPGLMEQSRPAGPKAGSQRPSSRADSTRSADRGPPRDASEHSSVGASEPVARSTTRLKPRPGSQCRPKAGEASPDIVVDVNRAGLISDRDQQRKRDRGGRVVESSTPPRYIRKLQSRQFDLPRFEAYSIVANGLPFPAIAELSLRCARPGRSQRLRDRFLACGPSLR